jgi:hypothetical protein
MRSRTPRSGLSSEENRKRDSNRAPDGGGGGGRLEKGVAGSIEGGKTHQLGVPRGEGEGQEEEGEGVERWIGVELVQ